MPRVMRNVSFATVDGIASVMDGGATVTVGGCPTRELIHRVTVLERPLERFVFVPERRNDAFAQMAESLWVMAGRDDIGWLSRYLPRAGDFSEDGGSTWRGAYGPRLRRWGGAVDQFAEVRRILVEERASRRAVMSLFDPGSDFIASKDIPCNNWLSWMLRDDKLHLAIAVRSNDAVWGFSGANAFEWSLLHEMMAFWLGAAVGRQTWIAASFHVYERHWDRAARIADGFHGRTPYDHALEPARFATPWADFDGVLDAWFAAEAGVRADPDAPLPSGRATSDPLLAAWLGAIRVRWGSDAWPESRLLSELQSLPPSDAGAATWEHLARDRPERLTAVKHPALVAYFAATGARITAEDRFKGAVKRLQERKDRAYGAAWKRRGELVSVLPNIARKVDRLAVFLEDGSRPADEAVLDTAVDLYVYATKYRLLLEERGTSSGLLPESSPRPYSDHGVNFERLVDMDSFVPADGELEPSIRNIVDIFERLWPSACEGESLAVLRASVDGLRRAARSLVSTIVRDDPPAALGFVVDEARRSAGEGAAR
jgi:thymidylate synthase